MSAKRNAQGAGSLGVHRNGYHTATTAQILRERPDIAAHARHFAARVVQDALAEATADHWLRRAEAFEAARPRSGDSYGRSATREDLQARYDHLTDVAAACRAAAHVALLRDDAIGADELAGFTVRGTL